MSLVIEEHPKFLGGIYCRSFNTKRIELQDELLKLYNLNENYDCNIFCSGMNAINNVFNLSDLESIVLSKDLYSDTPKLAKSIFYNVTEIETWNDQAVLEHFKNNQVSMFFIESISNPHSYKFNFSLIEQLRLLAPNCIFCVDNTWMTYYGFNPLKYDIDVVIESSTKYLSKSKCIGGIAIAKKQYADKLSLMIKQQGLFIGSDHCQYVLDGLEDLQSRMNYLSSIGLKLYNQLKNIDNIDEIYYVEPDNEVKLAPGCIYFHIKSNLSNNKCRKIFEKIKEIKIETSYGSSYSKIDPWAKFKNGPWIRLSIGYEDTFENLLTNLNLIISYFL